MRETAFLVRTPLLRALSRLLTSNFNFTSLIIKNPQSITTIPGQLIGSTTALRDSVGFSSISSWHGFATASGDNSIAFGVHAKAEGYHSIAFGNHAIAGGDHTFAFGNTVIAMDDNQFTVGKYSAVTSGNKYPFVVANGGWTEDDGKNIHALAWTGDAYHTGDVYVQGDGETAGFDGAKKLATEEYVNSPKNYIVLTDTVKGQLYHITVENGNLVSTLVEGGE